MRISKTIAIFTTFSSIANCSLLTAKETQIKSLFRHSRRLLAGIFAVYAPYTVEMPDYYFRA